MMLASLGPTATAIGIYLQSTLLALEREIRV